jgi:hypothetical protein
MVRIRRIPQVKIFWLFSLYRAFYPDAKDKERTTYRVYGRIPFSPTYATAMRQSWDDSSQYGAQKQPLGPQEMIVSTPAQATTAFLPYASILASMRVHFYLALTLTHHQGAQPADICARVAHGAHGTIVLQDRRCPAASDRKPEWPSEGLCRLLWPSLHLHKLAVLDGVASVRLDAILTDIGDGNTKAP